MIYLKDSSSVHASASNVLRSIDFAVIEWRCFCSRKSSRTAETTVVVVILVNASISLAGLEEGVPLFASRKLIDGVGEDQLRSCVAGTVTCVDLFLS